jgi:NO-binding membrane sensor protein with MHYT domain/two-component sensor histidine kinase
MTGAHNHWLVLLSVVVAITASYVALDLTGRAASHRHQTTQWYWLLGGAVAMGCGIWTMHFIGMLGFSLPIDVSYDVPITLLSLLIAMLASGFSLFVASRSALGFARLLGAGLLMGAAIAAMHYTGMAALRMEPPIRYVPLLFAASILIAVMASTAGLWAGFRYRMQTLGSAIWKKAGSALLVGTAIYGMHYTGMAAASFAPGAISAGGPQEIQPVLFAGVLGAFTMLFLAATLVVSAFDAYVAGQATQRADRLSRRLLEIQDAERRALAAELHDIVGQNLSAVNTELALLKSRMPAAASQEIAQASALVRESVEAIRSVMMQLRPPGLDELGLAAALRWHADAFKARTEIPVALDAAVNLPKPSPDVEDALLRVCLEALKNVSKHAAARHVEVKLEAHDSQIALRIEDDGRGFDPSAPLRRDEKSGWGLMIMRERAAAVGAQLYVESRPGAGTRVEFAVSEDRWQ